MKFYILLFANAFIFQGVKSSSNVDVDVIVNVGSGNGAKENDSPEMIKPTPKPVVPCGIPNRQLTRIVGGNATEVNEYPWQVALGYIKDEEELFFCGGTIITERWVMTAAHCDPWLSDFVDVGVHEMVGSVQSSPFYQRINITEVHRHERYSHTNIDNDIALVKLAEDLIFNEGVAPVCLPRRKQDQDFYDGLRATSVGLGLLKFNTSNFPEEMQEVDINVVPFDECLMVYEAEYGPGSVTETMLCAGPEEGLKGDCQGDSGGPLMITESVEDVYTQIGIVSWGEDCGTPEFPGVYARVDQFLDWIKKRTGYIYNKQ